MRGALVAVLLLAGCAGAPPPTPVAPTAHFVPPPLPGGAWVDPCPPQDAQPLAVDFRASAVNDTKGLAPGVHRVDAATFLWVYASYRDTDRQDRVSRVNEVTLAREPGGTLVACTRVDLVAPVQVDGKLRTYDVGVRFVAPNGLPPGPVRFTVNWVAGCTPCDPLPRGNDTATFEG